jgi:hypothetical protein
VEPKQECLFFHVPFSILFEELASALRQEKEKKTFRLEKK